MPLHTKIPLKAIKFSIKNKNFTKVFFFNFILFIHLIENFNYLIYMFLICLQFILIIFQTKKANVNFSYLYNQIIIFYHIFYYLKKVKGFF